MKIITHKTLDLAFTGTILVPVFETNSKSLVPIEFHGVSLPSKVFYGKKNTEYLVEKYDSLHIFIGLGKEQDHKTLRTIFRRAASKHKEQFRQEAALVLPDHFTTQQAEAVFTGLLLGTYNLGHLKKHKTHPFGQEDFVLHVISANDFTETAERAFKIAAAQLETLRLVDLPPNIATPGYLAKWAEEAAAKYGFKTTILDREQAKEQKLHAFLSVSKGSENEPCFIIMEYEPSGASPTLKHVGLVGKGITFDTGGLNIKTAGMVYMKSDMAGGAAVLGTMQLVAALQLPVKVTAIVPSCENSVDANSFRPSDVIQSYSGNTIEVIDTDAEGRLILADGLSYLIKNYKPETIVDIATLTGSSVATFGNECGAMFTNNDTLGQQLKDAGSKTGELLWQLPLWDAYKPDIESDIADVKNYHGKPTAGAITAAKFLEFFTEGHNSWAHLDVAGVAFGDDEFGKSKHATAYGVHLLTTFIENL